MEDFSIKRWIIVMANGFALYGIFHDSEDAAWKCLVTPERSREWWEQAGARAVQVLVKPIIHI